MNRAHTVCLVVLLAALVAACSATTSAAVPSSLSSPQRPESPGAASPQVLTGARLVAADWLYISNVAVSPRWFVWAGVETGDATRDPQRLVLLDRTVGQPRVIASAPDHAGLIAWLRINDDWAVWVDYTDRAAITDWRVRAMRLPAGEPTTLLSAPHDAGIDDRPEFGLSGDLLLISARPAGASQMRLISVSLRTGERRVVLSAAPGQSFGWPALEGDRAVVETRASGRDRLMLFTSVSAGRWSLLDGSSSMSEPTIAAAWLGYKAAPRGADGKFVIRGLNSNAETTVAGSVEAPFGDGSYFVWGAGGGGSTFEALNSETGRRYAISVERASRGLYAHDGRSLVYIITAYDGDRRYRLLALELPQ